MLVLFFCQWGKEMVLLATEYEEEYMVVLDVASGLGRMGTKPVRFLVHALECCCQQFHKTAAAAVSASHSTRMRD
jgi:hypothetical protein